MTKQIKAEKARALLDTSFRMPGGDAYLESMYGRTTEKWPVLLGVNWAACGTLRPYEARLFAMDLERLAHICEKINARQLEAVETTGRFFLSREEYRQACDQLTTWLEEGNAEAIIEWLEA